MPDAPDGSVPHDNPLSLSTAPIATHGVESGDAGNDAFEFGREVSLPQEVETRTAPPPAGQRAVRRPEVPAPAAPIRTAVPAVAPAPVPAPFAPAAAAAPVTHAAPATGSPSPPSPSKLQPEPFLTGARPAAVPPATRPGLHAQPSEPATAPDHAVTEAMVPISIPKGGSREIVLRIVITDSE